jgi:hypothetical protein
LRISDPAGTRGIDTLHDRIPLLLIDYVQGAGRDIIFIEANEQGSFSQAGPCLNVVRFVYDYTATVQYSTIAEVRTEVPPGLIVANADGREIACSLYFPDGLMSAEALIICDHTVISSV